MAVVIAWLATAGVVAHSERFGVSGTGHAGGIGKRMAALSVDDCAACQWTQGVQTAPVATVTLHHPILITHMRARLLVPRLASSRCIFLPPRAPPTLAIPA